jgi:hypothetical protein
MQNPVMERLDSFHVSLGKEKPADHVTRKEPGRETGFYYFGARYLDPKASVWISADPAMGDYVPRAPIDDEARKHNENLPGMGGVYNYVNMHVYHYAGNNPVKYVDPDGKINILGGIGAELGMQIAINWIEGKDAWDSATGEYLNANTAIIVNNPETLKKSIIKETGGEANGTLVVPDGNSISSASANSFLKSSGSVSTGSGSAINSSLQPIYDNSF